MCMKLLRADDIEQEGGGESLRINSMEWQKTDPFKNTRKERSGKRRKLRKWGTPGENREGTSMLFGFV